MVKMFFVEVVNGKPMLTWSESTEQYDLSGRIVIPSWDPKSTHWRWEILNVHNDSICCTLIYDDKPIFASRCLMIGKDGIGLILGGDKKFARSVNRSVYEYMLEQGITFLEPRIPVEASFYHSGAYTAVRVFDPFTFKECKSIAGNFTLDPQLPWLIRYTKVQGIRVTEWKAIYVPGGFHFEKPQLEVKPEVIPEELPKDTSEAAIVHEEVHVPEEEAQVAADLPVIPETATPSIPNEPIENLGEDGLKPNPAENNQDGVTAPANEAQTEQIQVPQEPASTPVEMAEEAPSVPTLPDTEVIPEEVPPVIGSDLPAIPLTESVPNQDIEVAAPASADVQVTITSDNPVGTPELNSDVPAGNTEAAIPTPPVTIGEDVELLPPDPAQSTTAAEVSLT